MELARNWFDVDKDGMHEVWGRRGVEHVLYELVANAWDEPGVTTVTVSIAGVTAREVLVTIEDDAPEGWADPRDIYTLFAPSKKKDNPVTRGRFNIGEKLVVAGCRSATVETMKGKLQFREDGTRLWNPQTKRQRGTKIMLALKLTAAQCKELGQATALLLPPDGITTVVNGITLTRPPEIRTLDVVLTTEVNLRPSSRKTQVTLLAPVKESWLYEMGIPVCQTDLPCHVDIGQKVPLTIDRETVRPAFLKDIGAVVLNGAYDLLTAEQATQAWCREAAGRSDCSAEATRHLSRLRFGEKAVAADPSDPESNARAMAAGYTVVHGGSLSKGEWENVRKAESFKPAGQVFGTPMPFSTNGEGKPLPEIPSERWTPYMRDLHAYCVVLGGVLLGRPIRVKLVNHRGWATPDGQRRVRACYGNGELILNLAYLPERGVGLHEVLLHELAHEYGHNHLSDEYHAALSKLGAKLAQAVVDDAGQYTPWFQGA